MKYRVIRDTGLGDDAPQVGDVVEKCTKCDYGLQSDHERLTGVEHINISKDGDYPFFTVPRSYVEEAGER